MRVATAGLAARESTMPVMISTAIAASISRSTVHHQLANRVRSTREIIDRISVGRAKRSLPAIKSSGGHVAALLCPPYSQQHIVYEGLTGAIPSILITASRNAAPR